MHILVAEIDRGAENGIARLLQSDNGAAEIFYAHTGDEAVVLGSLDDFDVVVLDLILPDTGGLDVIRRIRNVGKETPILVVSGLSHPATIARCFTAGGDDYVSNKISSDELWARIKNIKRREGDGQESIFKNGSVVLNVDTHAVLVNGAPLSLTTKEYRILELLFMQPSGSHVTNEKFIDHLYPLMDDKPNVSLVDIFFQSLGGKLNVAGADNVFVRAWALTSP